MKISILIIVPAERRHESADESITDTNAARITPANKGDKEKTAVGIAIYGFVRPGWMISADIAINPIAIAKISLKIPENITPNFADF